MTKKEAKTILQCRGNGYSEDEFNEALEIAYSALDSSLPSDLDEAAEEISQSAYSEPTADGFTKRSFFKRGFKAGAEWMAGQGVNSEGKVFTSAFTSYVKTPGIEELLKDAFPEDTEVIIQIRKKQ